jgi:hypothetical protein
VVRSEKTGETQRPARPRSVFSATDTFQQEIEANHVPMIVDIPDE